MCETSGSCAIPIQTQVATNVPYVQNSVNRAEGNSDSHAIKEPKKQIDETKNVCFYA